MVKLLSLFNRKKVIRPENRDYGGVYCNRCGSPKVIKLPRECGRVYQCGDKVLCKGCEVYINNKQLSEKFKCLQCGNVWSTLSSL